ncbi:hypothetical protein [Intrasporangium sp. YIM S08009]|uniref:hypothetical protein n=1 Tax=Intrasporangium zincisolvens TaxID=3080018 RepID=UPI002B060413|nr:hypothetical protein [Intrasporangium sp. YIM S08009]
MKRTRIAITLGAALALLTPAAASAASGPLAGTWASVDTDGSSQTLSITGTGNRVYAMVYADDVATSACGGAPAKVTGPGFTTGDGVVLVGALTCMPGGNHITGRIAISYVYDGASDTLTDDFGILWHRTS